MINTIGSLGGLSGSIFPVNINGKYYKKYVKTPKKYYGLFVLKFGDIKLCSDVAS